MLHPVKWNLGVEIASQSTQKILIFTIDNIVLLTFLITITKLPLGDWLVFLIIDQKQNKFKTFKEILQ